MIPKRPIHRCDHFHRTVLNGDGIFMNFDQLFDFLEILKWKKMLKLKIKNGKTEDFARITERLFHEKSPLLHGTPCHFVFVASPSILLDIEPVL